MNHGLMVGVRHEECMRAAVSSVPLNNWTLLADRSTSRDRMGGS